MDESTKEATEGWRWFSRDFVLGQERPEHRHADAQLLYAMRGVMLVKSGTVRRIITPNQALWIPAGTPHAIHFLSETAMRTLYFAKAPERMRVLRTLSITPLIRELMGTLILQLVQEAPVTPADLALPAETGLRRTAEMILSKGLWNTPLEQFAAALNMTPVTFSRHFQTDTGMTFRDWRHRARLTLSMELLAQGLTVKQTALRLGFSDPCVFTAAFRRLFGATPTALMRNHTKPAAT